MPYTTGPDGITLNGQKILPPKCSECDNRTNNFCRKCLKPLCKDCKSIRLGLCHDCYQDDTGWDPLERAKCDKRIAERKA